MNQLFNLIALLYMARSNLQDRERIVKLGFNRSTKKYTCLSCCVHHNADVSHSSVKYGMFLLTAIAYSVHLVFIQHAIRFICSIHFNSLIYFMFSIRKSGGLQTIRCKKQPLKLQIFEPLLFYFPNLKGDKFQKIAPGPL